jgi:hypothetical protein
MQRHPELNSTDPRTVCALEVGAKHDGHAHPVRWDGAERDPVHMRDIRVAFVGFGEVNTPRALIERKCAEACAQLEAEGIELITTAPVSDDLEGRDIARACRELAGSDFDLLVVCLAGWIPSHAVIAVVDQFRHKPMVLWGLSGWNEGGRLVTTADQAGTTALRKPMQDLGYCFKYVVNRLG